eukprot:2761005-Pleurochrysis_carterae.AAC.1
MRLGTDHEAVAEEQDAASELRASTHCTPRSAPTYALFSELQPPRWQKVMPPGRAALRNDEHHPLCTDEQRPNLRLSRHTSQAM